MSGRLPLEGVRVLDLSNLLAAPMATMYLGDFGADVIKAEHPARGDELRRWGSARDGVGLYFKVLGRNKRLVTLNLSHPDGQALVRRLVEHVDVVVENYRQGTLERWGIGWEQLRAINPGLILARVTGYGQTGPYRGRAGFGTNAEAFAGAAAISGFADRPPLLPSFGLGDSTTGIHAAFGIMVALYHRDVHGGEGQVIDLGLYEGLLTLLGPQVVNYDQLGILQERNGSRLPFIAPRNTYRCADGDWVSISATQQIFEKLVVALELEELLADPRFADNRTRIANVEALDEVIGEAVGRWPLAEVIRRCEEAGAAVAPVNDARLLLDDPHVRERGNVVAVADEELGPIRMQNVVPRLDGTPGRIDHAGARLGEHNDEVYGGLLGLDRAERDRLRELGAI